MRALALILALIAGPVAAQVGPQPGFFNPHAPGALGDVTPATTVEASTGLYNDVAGIRGYGGTFDAATGLTLPGANIVGFSSGVDGRSGNADTVLCRGAAGVVNVALNNSCGTGGKMSMAGLTMTGPLVRKGYTVATLPAAPGTGAAAFVTDAVACTFLATLTGGGAAWCPVGYNGAAWVAE